MSVLQRDLQAGGELSGDAAQRRAVVSTETGGLGNRLKSWVSAMRLDPAARVHWPVTDNMPAPFSALFDNDCGVDDVPEDAATHASWRLLVLPEDDAHLPEGFTTVGAATSPLLRGLGKLWWDLRGRPDDRYRYMLFPKSHSRRSARRDGRHIDLEYDRIPRYFRDVYAPLFARIVVREAVAALAAEWADAHLGPDVVGVQIRTWRDHAKRHRKYHRPAMKRLQRLMQGAGADTRFLVVSDDDAVIAELEKCYGRRILQYPRRTERALSWRSAEGVAEDLVDMLLLARTQRLFASYLSTFSEAAWWLGGARARVSVF